LLGNDVILVEYLTNLRALTRQEVELVVAPLKVKGGDGAPVRCFAIQQG
jgi:arylformamidase